MEGMSDVSDFLKGIKSKADLLSMEDMKILLELRASLFFHRQELESRMLNIRCLLNSVDEVLDMEKDKYVRRRFNSK